MTSSAPPRPIVDGYDFMPDLDPDGGTWDPASRKDCLQMAGIGFCGVFLCLFIAGMAALLFNVTPRPALVPTTIATTR